MPGSWFYRLRRKRSAGRGSAAEEPASKPPESDRAIRAPAAPLAANRASYYVPSGDRPGGTSKGGGNGGSHRKVRDTRFPRSPRQQQHADIVFDVDRASFGLVKKAMPMLPELNPKLRPILTRPAANSSNGGGCEAPSPKARLMRRRKLHGGGKGRPAAAKGMKEQRRPAWRRWLRESVVVVKESADPEEDFLASMAEMMMMAAAANDGDDRGLEELLACYLALNAADHHRAIVAAFRRALAPSSIPTSTRQPSTANANQGLGTLVN